MITGKITNERKKIMLRFSVNPSLRINTLKWSLFTIGFLVGSKSGKKSVFRIFLLCYGFLDITDQNWVLLKIAMIKFSVYAVLCVK